MNELTFDTGLKTFTINGVCEVTFNPTDTNFVGKLYKAFDALDAKQTAYKADVANFKDDTEIFDYAVKCDKEMREILDGVFDAPISDKLFGGMNAYAMANGLPVWCNLMMAVMDEIDASFEKEKKITNPRIEKYVRKYQKYKKK